MAILVRSLCGCQMRSVLSNVLIYVFILWMPTEVRAQEQVCTCAGTSSTCPTTTKPTSTKYFHDTGNHDEVHYNEVHDDEASLTQSASRPGPCVCVCSRRIQAQEMTTTPIMLVKGTFGFSGNNPNAWENKNKAADMQLGLGAGIAGLINDNFLSKAQTQISLPSAWVNLTATHVLYSARRLRASGPRKLVTLAEVSVAFDISVPAGTTQTEAATFASLSFQFRDALTVNMSSAGACKQYVSSALSQFTCGPTGCVVFQNIIPLQILFPMNPPPPPPPPFFQTAGGTVVIVILCLVGAIAVFFLIMFRSKVKQCIVDDFVEMKADEIIEGIQIHKSGGAMKPGTGKHGATGHNMPVPTTFGAVNSEMPPHAARPQTASINSKAGASTWAASSDPLAGQGGPPRGTSNPRPPIGSINQRPETGSTKSKSKSTRPPEAAEL